MIRFFIFVISTAVITGVANAQNIYKWVDDNGVTHFTSIKPHASARPAELPEIMRGEFKLDKRKLKSCKSHGGVNCQAGADKDGSVICVDGFVEASARFKFTCKSPKLTISDVSPVNEDGTFKVFLRNERSVAASAPKIQFHLPGGNGIELSGPGEIEPFGIAEFTFVPVGELGPREQVTEAQLSVSCANCG